MTYSQDRPSAYLKGDQVHIRASAQGLCPRALAAMIRGVEGEKPSEALKRAATEGHIHEEVVLDGLIAAGLKIRDRQGICQATYDIDGIEFVVTGRFEGVLYAGSDPYAMWENKSMSENQFKLWKQSLDHSTEPPTPTFSKHMRYAWQISHYMSCRELPVLYTAKNRNTGEMIVSWLKDPPYSELDIKNRLREIVVILEAGDAAFADNTYCDPNTTKWFCPYKDRFGCLRSSDTDVEEVDDPELERMLVQYRAANDSERDGKKIKNELKPLIKERVGSGKVETTLGYTASVKPQNYLDREALEKFLAKHGKSMDDFQKEIKTLRVKGP